MNTSIVMDELRKIRDGNSLRHHNMTNEEVSQEHREAVEWFVSKFNKPIEVISLPS